MQIEEKHTLWKLSAGFIGASMPLILFGRAVFAVVFVLGLIFGALATKGDSLRSSLKMVKNSKLNRFVLFFILALGLSAIFSVDRMYSLSVYGQIVAVWAASCLFFVVLREMPPRHVHASLQALCVSVVITMILAVIDAYVGDPRLAQALHGTDATNMDRLSDMGAVFAVLTPFLWAWLLNLYREQAVLAQWLAFPIAILSFWAVFVCGGFAGMLAVTLAAGVFLFNAGKMNQIILHRRHWLLALAVLALGPVAFAATRGKEYLVGAFNMLKNGEFTFALPQWESWLFSAEHVLDNPATGIGLAAMRKMEGLADVSSTHPHNFVVQIILETGLIGTAAAVAVLGYLLMKFSHMGRHNLYGLAGLSAVVAFFSASLFDLSLFYSWWLACLVFSSIYAVRLGWVEKPRKK